MRGRQVRGRRRHGGRAGRGPGTALLLVALVLHGCSGSGSLPPGASASPSAAPSVTASAASLAPTGTAATASPTPTRAAGGWVLGRTPGLRGADSAPPVAIAVGPNGAVIVGERAVLEPEGPDDHYAAAFRSDDLVTWEPSRLDAGLRLGSSLPTSGPLAGMGAVTWGGAGFVAVGIDLVPGVTGVAWRSDDGTRWIRAPLPGTERARPAGIAWTGGRYVAIGVDEAPTAPRMAVWTSPDGLAWTRLPDGPAFAIGDYLDTGEYRAWAGPASLSLDEAGRLLAAGRVCVGGRRYGDPIDCAGAIWRSDDGTTWTRELQPGTLPGPVAAGATLGERVVLVGATADEFGNVETGRVVVVEPAGTGGTADWQVVELPDLPALSGVAVLDGVAYALGAPMPVTSGRGPVISLWASSDGRAWREVAGLPPLPDDVGSIRGVELVATDDRLVILVSVEVDGSPTFVGIVLAGRPAA
ncbi:MAG: hypothetical protein RL338_1316 [Chloroflexota bacterium]